MAELQVDPGAIAADGSTVLQAADQLTGLGGDLRAGSFGGSTVAAAESGYADFASRWRAGASELDAGV